MQFIPSAVAHTCDLIEASLDHNEAFKRDRGEGGQSISCQLCPNKDVFLLFFFNKKKNVECGGAHL